MMTDLQPHPLNQPINITTSLMYIIVGCKAYIIIIIIIITHLYFISISDVKDLKEPKVLVSSTFSSASGWSKCAVHGFFVGGPGDEYSESHSEVESTSSCSLGEGPSRSLKGNFSGRDKRDKVGLEVLLRGWNKSDGIELTLSKG